MGRQNQTPARWIDSSLDMLQPMSPTEPPPEELLLTSEQTREIERLKVQATKLKACNERILEITEEIQGSTIDSILAMDEFELIDAVLSGKLKPPT